ncbi:NAD(P)-dependent oxidoreductase [Faecalicoccus pleomorphus]|uniref:NAD(P)-dependent oxidoreductase n=1 Tax=Faecalicoccus pleomorphus TaxID=1323 RepID=UPI00189B85AB|nr:NAD(P)-dependent oxidoreductase [Faecalicoccus pleomorphus]MDB7984235.1 NAD(P)-dependent oxidoreductase [Faecalicoccus pleomorphus]
MSQKVAIVNANSFGRYFPEYIEMLKDKVGDVERFTVDKNISATELSEQLQGYEYLIVGTTPQFSEDFFKLTPSIKYIARFGIGYNNVDVLGAKKYDVIASNIPGVLEKEDVAEHAVGLLMSLIKHSVDGDKAVRSMEWNVNRGRFLGMRLHGKTVGVLGMGNIGKTFAHIMANGFGCKILGYDPYLSKEEMEKRGAEKKELDEILAESDVLSLHINLTNESYHLMNKECLQKVKTGAYIVNTARGELVDEVAMCEALKEGKLAGYGADVIEAEPPKEDNPLLTCPHTVLTPHLATYNAECNRQMCKSIVDDVVAVSKGQKPSVVLEK